MALKKRKKKAYKPPTTIRSTLEQVLVRLGKKSVDTWDPNDFIDYVATQKALYYGVTFSAVRGAFAYRSMRDFSLNYGTGAKTIIDGLFLFARDLGYSPLIKRLLETLPHSFFRSSKFESTMRQSLSYMQSYEKQKNLPAFCTRPRAEWTSEDWKEFEAEVKRRAQHGKTKGI